MRLKAKKGYALIVALSLPVIIVLIKQEDKFGVHVNFDFDFDFDFDFATRDYDTFRLFILKHRQFLLRL